MSDQEKESSVTLDKPAETDITELSDSSSLSDSDPEDSPTQFDAEAENLSSSGESSPDQNPLGDRMSSSPRKASFQLKGGSAGFSSRSQNIFDCLESAAKMATPGLGDDNVIDGTFLRPMPPFPQRKRDEKRNSAGGKPLPKPPSAAAEVPQSPTHSARYTKYSLEDVAETSDRKNSQVALEYLQGLQQRKEGSLASGAKEPFMPAFNQDHSSGGDSKILFSRPSRRDEGQMAKDKPPEGNNKKKEVGLAHLEEPEEEPKSTGRSSGQLKRICASVEEEDDDGQQQSVGFLSSRKVNRNKFRKAVEQEECD
ncbi:hypothetical protein GJAV_G00256790 [Gymnothorax javanicus]|nr:hypothetical protein GJAV_G00256790 [Gymnothorax javanicus]